MQGISVQDYFYVEVLLDDDTKEVRLHETVLRADGSIAWDRLGAPIASNLVRIHGKGAKAYWDLGDVERIVKSWGFRTYGHTTHGGGLPARAWAVKAAR